MRSLILSSVFAASLVSAHAGCDGYQHGVDLFKRDPTQDAHLAELRKRHPQVNARVIQNPALEKRASPTTYAATLLQVNSAAVAALASGTGTPGGTTNLPTTYPAGSTSPIQGAQPLPAVSINPADWPTLDRPVDPTASVSQQLVQTWMSQIDMNGIPNIPVTAPGGCQNASNAEAVAAATTNGWWTCGGVTRSTDITYCPNSNTWGLSYDDGPSPYTPKLMNYLNAAQLKSTMFVVGSRVISRPDMLQYEYLDGHQIAVHTWSHFPLTTLTNEQIVAELGWSKKAIYEVTGVTPKYMRPPYGDIDDRVRYISMQMGLIPIIWTAYNGQTFDTRDWQIAGGVVNVSTVINNFDTILNQAPNMGHGFIVLEHDLYQQSVELAVDYVLPMALANSALSIQPIIECVGQNMAQAYVETATNSTSANVPTSPIAGASGTGHVQGLTVTPVAIGGDYTGAGSTLGGRGAQSTGSSNANTNQDSSDAKSGASALTTSLFLLLGTAAVIFVMA